jgi:hypothetical protein
VLTVLLIGLFYWSWPPLANLGDPRNPSSA